MNALNNYRELKGTVTFHEGPKTTYEALENQIDTSRETIIALFSFSLHQQPGPQNRQISSREDFDGVNSSLQHYAATSSAGFIAVPKDKIDEYLK